MELSEALSILGWKLYRRGLECKEYKLHDWILILPKSGTIKFIKDPKNTFEFSFLTNDILGHITDLIYDHSKENELINEIKNILAN